MLQRLIISFLLFLSLAQLQAASSKLTILYKLNGTAAKSGVLRVFTVGKEELRLMDTSGRYMLQLEKNKEYVLLFTQKNANMSSISIIADSSADSAFSVVDLQSATAASENYLFCTPNFRWVLSNTIKPRISTFSLAKFTEDEQQENIGLLISYVRANQTDFLQEIVDNYEHYGARHREHFKNVSEDQIFLQQAMRFEKVHINLSGQPVDIFRIYFPGREFEKQTDKRHSSVYFNGDSYVEYADYHAALAEAMTKLSLCSTPQRHMH